MSYVTVTLDWPVEEFSFFGQRQYKQARKALNSFLDLQIAEFLDVKILQVINYIWNMSI